MVTILIKNKVPQFTKGPNTVQTWLQNKNGGVQDVPECYYSSVEVRQHGTGRTAEHAVAGMNLERD